jgi:Ca2+-binding RTX toxin-like protein
MERGGVSGRVRFGDGERVETVRVKLAEDGRSEGVEIFDFVLGKARGGDVVRGTRRVEGRAEDGDAGTRRSDKLAGSRDGDEIDGGDRGDVIRAGPGDDLVFGGDGPDRLYGQAGSDSLLVGEGRDRAWGGAGDDFLYGGLGEDRLKGGRGDDELRASGLGDDRMWGGAGRDHFRMTAAPSDGSRDVIEDFEIGRDRIQISGGHLARDGEAGPPTGARASLSERRGGDLLSIDWDRDGTADHEVFVRLERGQGLSESDFLF